MNHRALEPEATLYQLSHNYCPRIENLHSEESGHFTKHELDKTKTASDLIKDAMVLCCLPAAAANALTTLGLTLSLYPDENPDLRGFKPSAVVSLEPRMTGTHSA